MTSTSPFLFQDFVRVKDTLHAALRDDDDSYLLLTGDTGTGKTTLLASLRSELDRGKYRILYFSEARRLTAAGLVRVMCQCLRVDPRRSHSESVHVLTRVLADDSQRVLVWIDEGHELPEETLAEARSLVESDLQGGARLHVLLAGLPKLRSDLQSFPPLWRRIVVREEITGLVFDELAAFLEHSFGEGACERLCNEGRTILFERAKGAPGFLIPMFRTLLRVAKGKKTIEPELVDDALRRWDLP